MIKISLQKEDIDIAEEYQLIQKSSLNSGAIVQFTGIVRPDYFDERNESELVQSLSIEHYPGMTEKAINNIVLEAQQRWDLEAVTVIHRTGIMQVHENIVLVIAAATHRAAAFDASMFIMDFLKNDVPLWKKHMTASDSNWVEQKQSDKMRKKLWD